jgi:hypothetical protein
MARNSTADTFIACFHILDIQNKLFSPIFIATSKMIHEYINKPGAGMFILLAPLDWGLGHATRCIPIIRALQNYGAEVVLGRRVQQRPFCRRNFRI